jgi:serine/threonine protein kinase
MVVEEEETTRGPTSFGKYRIVAELGRGGMANVYLALMQGPGGFNKLVVLKVPRDAITQEPNLLAMFMDEARLAARLNHPNVVQTYEVIQQDGKEISVMEYLEGQPLSEVLMRARRLEKPVPLGLHLRIISEVLTGLHYTHEATDFDGSSLDLVHRDVSPQNIFITFDGVVKVLDFGIAKSKTSIHTTEVGTFKGKVRYMPAEQITGGEVDRRADIFAVGAILWEAVVGVRLWRGRSDVEVIGAVIQGERHSARAIDPRVAPELEAICSRALAPQREHRYSNCLELQGDLEAFLGTLPDKYGSREVAALMSELFAETREERRRIIEEQIAKASRLPQAEYQPLGPNELPMPSLGALSSSGPRSIEPSEQVMAVHRGHPGLYALATLVGVAVIVAVGVLLSRRPSEVSTASVPAAHVFASAPEPAAPAPTPIPPASAPEPVASSAGQDAAPARAARPTKWPVRSAGPIATASPPPIAPSNAAPPTAAEAKPTGELPAPKKPARALDTGNPWEK